MSATESSIPIIKVLITLHPGMDALDFIGPLETLSHARHDINDACKFISMLHVMPLLCIVPLATVVRS